MGTKEKIKRICWKTLWGFLSVVFILTNGFSLTAFAADDTEKQGTESKELTGLSIAYLNDPEPGNPLDCTAVVLSAEGVCWEIPVIWIDANGNTVYVAKEGEQYFPVFVFYMPEGYTIATMEADGRFYVKLPYYVTNLYGTDGWFFIADPALNITFITYGLQYSSTSGPAAVSQVWNAELNRQAEAAAKAEEQAVLSEHSHHHHSSSSDDDKLPVGYVDTASEEEETPDVRILIDDATGYAIDPLNGEYLDPKTGVPINGDSGIFQDGNGLPIEIEVLTDPGGGTEDPRE